MMTYIYYLFFLCSLLVIPLAQARVLGTYGDTYPIAEQDFLAFIQHRLTVMKASGQLEQFQKQLQTNSQQHAERPTPVANITRTAIPRSWIFNPAITLPHDVKDSNGNVFAKKGTQFNPLEKVRLTKALLFFDSDDRKQVTWAQKLDRQLQGKTKLILVKGSIVQAGKQFQKPIFFDQQGRLTTRFTIQHTPALVIQEGLMLRIQEVKP